MFAKQLTILSIIALILVTNIYAQSDEPMKRQRGVRDYELELPASRSAIDRKHGSSNETSAPDVPNPNPNPQPKSKYVPIEGTAGCRRCVSNNYLTHYYERNCTARDVEVGCGSQSCPKYFVCPQKSPKTPTNGCEYKGQVYGFGAEVPVDNPCKRGCYCDENAGSRPTIRCAEVDCFNHIRAPQTNCFNVYEPDKCCPRLQCPSPDTQSSASRCLYDGRRYHLGETIYPKEDHCLECRCVEGWDENKPLNSTGTCRRIRCHMDSNPKFREGCLPIYHERTCCPIDYYCPPSDEHQCLFGGRKYLIGEHLNIGRNDRTECTCLVPPEFTCVERSRVHTYKRVDSAPKVETTTGTSTAAAAAGVVNFPTEAPVAQKCAPFIPEGLQCAGTNCTTIIDDNGCQACRCQKPCPVFKCQGSCRLFAVTPGECPKCKCG